MKTFKFTTLFSICFLSFVSCVDTDIKKKEINRHQIGDFLQGFFEGNKLAHEYKSADFLDAFNNSFETNYSIQTIQDFRTSYLKDKEPITNISTSVSDNDVDISILKEIEGYDYFEALYYYDSISVDLFQMETKVLSDNRISEEVASSLLGLIYVKRLFNSQREQMSSMSSQCPDTPGNAQCMNECEIEYDRDSKITFSLMLGATAYGIGTGISGGPVGMGLGLIGGVGFGLISQAIVFSDYEQCKFKCDQNFPCQ